MALTKPQIIQMLTEAGATFDPNDNVPNLKTILAAATADGDDAAATAPVDATAAPTTPATPAAPVEAAPVAAAPAQPAAASAAPTVDADHQARWDAYLVTARSERRDPAIFDAQKAAGEFDKIPATFA